MMNDDIELQFTSASACTPGSLPADVKADVADVPDAQVTANMKDSPSKSQGESKTDANANNKITKRRAARACASCRTRKVRCDVVEQFPCANCRWDNVTCIVHESRRRRCVTYLLCPFFLDFSRYSTVIEKQSSAASFSHQSSIFLLQNCQDPVHMQVAAPIRNNTNG